MRKISLEEARQIALRSQGLAARDPFGTGAPGALAALEHMGYVQIDTISVVERAHHHVFWTRVSDFTPSALTLLVATRKAFEYWSHAAAYLPMRDFRFSLPRKRLYASGKHHWFTPTPEYKRARRRVLARLKEGGPVSIRDFPRAKKGASGWFERSPEKQALEQLFMEGVLMLSGRNGFEKNYELTERVLPPDVNDSLPTPREQAAHLILTALRAHGLARADEIAYLRRADARALVEREARSLLKEGVLEEIFVEGQLRPYFALAGWEKHAGAVAEGARILSPFDNHVIQRRRMQELFAFDFTIECYLPAEKRRWGYFCLPVLDGTRFIGRLDAKADRARGVLELKALHAEEMKKGELRERLSAALPEFARFNGCSRIEK